MITINRTISSQREHNILTILGCIIDATETSAQEIAKSSGLSFATISRVTNMLIARKIIITTGKEITEMGRHPNILSLNLHYGYVAHFDILSDRVQSVMAKLDGQPIAFLEHYFSSPLSVEELINSLLLVFEKLLKKTKIQNKKVLAVGFSVPGIVDKKNNSVKRIPNIFPDLNFDIAKTIAQAFDKPTIIDNDANLAAIGEHIKCYTNLSNMVYIAITESYGVGGGIIFNGEIFNGVNGAAGEVGEMCFSVENFNEYCVSEMGCLERYSGLKSIYSILYHLMENGRAQVLAELLKNNPVLNVDLIERSIEKGDLDVADLYDNIIRIWAMGIINIGAIIDPELIVVGGVFCENNKFTLSRIQHYVSKALYYSPKIVMSSIGETQALQTGGIQAIRSYALNNIVFAEAIR